MFVSENPGYVYNSLFALDMHPFKDYSAYTSGLYTPDLNSGAGGSAEIQNLFHGTFLCTFSLGSGGISAINSVDVWSFCTSTNVTFLSQTKTSGAYYDAFTLMVQVTSLTAEGAFQLPNTESALDSCFGSNWTSGQFYCYALSIVKLG